MTIPLPPRLEQYPELDKWLRIDAGETITVFTGKVEIGQGIGAALARIAAEELDVGLERVRVAPADTAHDLNELLTASSASMMESGSALRQAAAEARAHLLELAARRLETPAADLVVEDGTVSSRDGFSITYWALMRGRRFARVASGHVRPKVPAEHRVVGRMGVGRRDQRGIVTGTTRFVQDLRLPEMLHGRVLRPPAPGARLESLREAGVGEMPGVVAVVRDGSFVGVLAEREGQAGTAVEALRTRARWSPGTRLPPSSQPADWLLDQAVRSFLVVDGTPAGEPPPPPPEPEHAARTLRATFTRPYLMHGSIGPSAAMAQWDDRKLTVWSSSQGIYILRDALAAALRVAAEDVRVIHVPGAGCYGHNGADDAALDAALLARAAGGRPVLCKWTRADEHRWEPYGAPGVVKLQASLDEQGRVIDWRHEAWGTTHLSRPMPGGSPKLLAGAHLERPVPHEPPRPFLMREAGIHRNATPIYELPRIRIVKHFVEAMPLRTSSLRSLGAHLNVFAIESFMDGLAAAAGCSPLEFRRRYLSDRRSLEVMEAAADKAGWDGEPTEEFGLGTGIGLARYKNAAGYAAVVVRARVDDETAQVAVERVVIAADVGEIVDPGGVSNQLEGGFLQSASWTLIEQVNFDSSGVTSQDWETYPILRFGRVPPIETVLMDRPGEPYLGTGEVVQGPAAAAIGNAVRDAIGVAPQRLPLTPERIRDAVLVA
jgi:nicotinate dehydrogenase subunit B